MITLDQASRLLESPPPATVPGQSEIPTGPRIGSLCTGYGGLDTAAQEVLGGSLAWVADPDPGPAAILAHHWPDVPNLGDLTAVEWSDVERVEILLGGYPCQPFSLAGPKRGIADERHIWPYIARAIRVLRPRLCIFENVANHVRLGLDNVLADLAAIGFDAEWIVVRASDVGAAHQRARLFLAAWPTADAPHIGHERSGRARRRGTRLAHGRSPVAHTVRTGLEIRGIEPTRNERPPVERSGSEPAQWAEYAPAIARWERVTGRPAPAPVDDQRRLAAPFVEWHMGLPAGHVTGVPGLSRNAQIRALGNGVVPAQAAYAIRILLARAGFELAV